MKFFSLQWEKVQLVVLPHRWHHFSIVYNFGNQLSLLSRLMWWLDWENLLFMCCILGILLLYSRVRLRWVGVQSPEQTENTSLTNCVFFLTVHIKGFRSSEISLHQHSLSRVGAVLKVLKGCSYYLTDLLYSVCVSKKCDSDDKSVSHRRSFYACMHSRQ